MGDGEGGNSHIIRIGVLVITVRSWKKAVMVLLRVFSLKRPTVGTFTLPFRIFGQKNRTGGIWQSFLSYFFVKKYYLLVGMSGVCYGRVNGWVSEWVGEWVSRWVSERCMYVTPIRLDLLWTANQISCCKGKWYVRRFDLNTVQNSGLEGSVTVTYQ